MDVFDNDGLPCLADDVPVAAVIVEVGDGSTEGAGLLFRCIIARRWQRIVVSANSIEQGTRTYPTVHAQRGRSDNTRVLLLERENENDE